MKNPALSPENCARRVEVPKGEVPEAFFKHHSIVQDEEVWIPRRTQLITPSFRGVIAYAVWYRRAELKDL